MIKCKHFVFTKEVAKAIFPQKNTNLDFALGIFNRSMVTKKI